jgi:hypothetical protein
MTPILPLLLAATTPTSACADASSAKIAAATLEGDPAARSAAQKGLDFLAKAAEAWQGEHQCYGCHVQGVTLEAMTVGRAHQYKVRDTDLDAIVKGMLELPGGVHQAEGFTYTGGQLSQPAKGFGGTAFAHYDERVGPRLRQELIKTADELLAFQQQDGSVVGDYANFPVANGRMQATVQAIVTWRQTHERTADDRWLVPIRKAERWVRDQAKRMSDGELASLYDANYALIGLVSAGAGPSDRVVSSLVHSVHKRALGDGGFGFDGQTASSAFMTGQTLYALRLAGASDADGVVRSGTKYLIAHQGQDGGWGASGSGKAEAMWAVLGLVSMDKVSIDVAGIEDGAHVDGDPTLGIKAADNTGAAVKKLTLVVDDTAVSSSCGPTMSANLPKLTTGMHTVDVVAESDGGKTTTRRLEVYAGDAWLDEVGTRFDNGQTVVGFRDLAPDAMNAKVRVTVKDDAKKVVSTSEIKSQNGAMAWNFDGKKSGRYTAEVSLLDDKGAVRESKEVVFSHESYEAQKAKYAEVAGAVALPEGGASQNAEIELVDDKGDVVQRTATTKSGQYRFQNVDAGKYKVRVKKQGFDSVDMPVAAAAGAEAAAPMAAPARH